MMEHDSCLGNISKARALVTLTRTLLRLLGAKNSHRTFLEEFSGGDKAVVLPSKRMEQASLLIREFSKRWSEEQIFDLEDDEISNAFCSASEPMNQNRVPLQHLDSNRKNFRKTEIPISPGKNVDFITPIMSRKTKEDASSSSKHLKRVDDSKCEIIDGEVGKSRRFKESMTSHIISCEKMPSKSSILLPDQDHCEKFVQESRKTISKMTGSHHEEWCLVNDPALQPPSSGQWCNPLEIPFHAHSLTGFIFDRSVSARGAFGMGSVKSTVRSIPCSAAEVMPTRNELMLAKAKPILYCRGHRDSVCSLKTFLQNDEKSHFMSASFDNTIRIWTISDHASAKSHLASKCRSVARFSQDIHGASIIPTTNEIFVSFGDRVTIFHPLREDSQQTLYFPIEQQEHSSSDWNPSCASSADPNILTFGARHTIGLLDRRVGEVVSTIQSDCIMPLNTELSNDGYSLICGGLKASVWDLRSPSSELMFFPKSKSVMGVDFVHFSPGDVTILGSSTDRLQEWSTVSRRQYQSIRYENRTLSKVSDFSINSDGLVLVPMAKQSLMVYHRIGKALRGFCLSSLNESERKESSLVLHEYVSTGFFSTFESSNLFTVGRDEGVVEIWGI